MEEQYAQNQTFGQTQINGQQQPYGQQPYQQQNQMYGQQPYQQQYPYYAQPARAVVSDTMPMKQNNMAISGLVFGIFAILGFWAPVAGLTAGIIGIVCSAIGLAKKDSRKGMAIAGLILSIVAIMLSLIILFLYIVFS